MADYSVFALPAFNPNEYANAILAGDPYPTPDPRPRPSQPKSADSIPKEDISVAISKISFAVDDVAKQIKALVTGHHEQLLAQAANASTLSGSLANVRSGLTELDASVDKLRLKIHVPYENLQSNVSRLQKLHQVSDILRRTSRFVMLARRLQVQMTDMAHEPNEERPLHQAISNTPVSASASQMLDVEDEKERTIAKAALSIAELVSLLDDNVVVRGHPSAPVTAESLSVVPLRSIRAVALYESFIENARSTVTNEMENMVLTGLTTLNQTLLASSLQTAYNLGVLPTLVQGLLLDLSQAVEDRIRNAFDTSRISKDVLGRDSPHPSQPPQIYRSRIRTEPTNATASQWSAALWTRLESMFEEMADCCVKVYTLEKVLKMKKDTTTQVLFLEEAMKALENQPSAIFWTSLSQYLEKYSREASNFRLSSADLEHWLPAVLRLFHDFFSKIAVHTDTVYGDKFQSPETILVLRAFSNIESSYLSRTTNKLNEAIGQMFSGGSRSPPGANEGANLARLILNELDSARFDPLLVKSVSKIAASSLDVLVSRVDGLATRDRSAVILQGPSATPQQACNAQLASCLYQCSRRLDSLKHEYTDGIFYAIRPSSEAVSRAYEQLTDPLASAIRRELGAIIAKVHRIDFGQSLDPRSGISGASSPIKELTERLGFIKTELLDRYSIGDLCDEWKLSIVKFVIKTFLLHISIATPLGESGKLQITSDMTELEFALSTFISGNGQNKRGRSLDRAGEEYRAYEQ
ncbi:Golgi transport complex subunit 5-domain-containing protein [Cyathus striatus]|nr:Golgi transport complex subunit 5-domain-containing protein [Cyathus striatus]